MAEMFNPQNPQNAQMLDLARQRKIADLLVSRGLEAPSQGQTVSGGVYVPVNPMEHIAKLFSVYTGTEKNKELDQQQMDMAEALRKQGVNEVNDILTLAQGRKELPSQELAGPAYNGVAPSIQYPAVQANPQEALARALNAQTPQAQSLTAPLMQNLLPKKTDKLIEYEAYKADTPEGKRLSFTDWADRLEKQKLALEEKRYGLQAATFNLEKKKAEQELINGKPLTEFQGKATNFGIQMAGSMKEMAAVENSGFNPVDKKNQALLAVSGTSLGNMVVPSEVQRYKQAMDNFTENFIRFKSGANVPMHEIEKDLKNMMPQAGDLPEKIEQKQRARERALEGMAISAGPGVKHIINAYSVEAPGMKGATPNAKLSPSAWGQATVVEK